MNKSLKELQKITAEIISEIQKKTNDFVDKTVREKAEPREIFSKIDPQNLTEEDKKHLESITIEHSPLINGKKRTVTVKQNKLTLGKMEIIY